MLATHGREPPGEKGCGERRNLGRGGEGRGTQLEVRGRCRFESVVFVRTLICFSLPKTRTKETSVVT